MEPTIDKIYIYLFRFQKYVTSYLHIHIHIIVRRKAIVLTTGALATKLMSRATMVTQAVERHPVSAGVSNSRRGFIQEEKPKQRRYELRGGQDTRGSNASLNFKEAATVTREEAPLAL